MTAAMTAATTVKTAAIAADRRPAGPGSMDGDDAGVGVPRRPPTVRPAVAQLCPSNAGRRVADGTPVASDRIPRSYETGGERPQPVPGAHSRLNDEPAPRDSRRAAAAAGVGTGRRALPHAAGGGRDSAQSAAAAGAPERVSRRGARRQYRRRTSRDLRAEGRLPREQHRTELDHRPGGWRPGVAARGGAGDACRRSLCRTTERRILRSRRPGRSRRRSPSCSESWRASPGRW